MERLIEKIYIMYNKLKSVQYCLNIKVFSNSKTINRIINDKCSISRFGDGEIYIINGYGIKFQEYDKLLSDRLKEILNSNNKNHLICIPEIVNPRNIKYRSKKNAQWARKYFYNNCENFVRLFDRNREYYGTTISRFWIPYKNKKKARENASLLKTIWDNRNILIIEGEKTRMGIGNDLFSNANQIKRILCPAENAFTKYNEILNESLKYDKNYLILIALGPTATVLAYDLFINGYQALDIGHLDLEYEWMKRGLNRMTLIEGKYVNELENGNIVDDVDDYEYKNQIAKIII